MAHLKEVTELLGSLQDLRTEAFRNFEKILEAAPLSVCTIEMPSLRYVQANTNYCQMVHDHVGPKEVVGRTVFEVLPTANPYSIEALYRAHEKNEPTKFDTITSTSIRRGQTYWTGAILPVLRRDGKTYVMSLLAEITDKVVAERAAMEKRADLKAALDSLYEERRKKDEFVAIAVHELRTPLTSLKAMTQLLLRRFDQLKPADVRERLARLDKQASELSRLIGDLLDTTKVASNKLALVSVPTPICHLTREVASQFAALNPSHEVRIEIPCNGSLCEAGKERAVVMADPGRYTQVLTNLLGNAVHYSEAGTEILVRIIEEDECIKIEVKDHGVGLKPESLERVFDCYYQAPERKRAGGLGLGLYLAKDMVTRMSGRIWATSEGLGKGSSFFIELPRASLSGVAALLCNAIGNTASPR